MTQHYDIIGDIHGQHDKLIGLLAQLDYQPQGSSWKHPEGRKVVFLGDYVDRGPKVREVLHTVRSMVEAGDALAIMGNHEFNLICYHTQGTDGDWLRPRTEKNTRQNAATRAAFAHDPAELDEWLQWLRKLPVTLELDGFRAVHACWDERYVPILPNECFLDDEFLLSAGSPDTREYVAAETLLKGPELSLPKGSVFIDKEGTEHTRIRVKWWDIAGRRTLGEVTMPKPTVELLRLPLADDALRLANYPATDKPVFFGHYWLPADAPKAPLAPNIGCLDFSAGLGGPLVAYRWSGEQELDVSNYVTGLLR